MPNKAFEEHRKDLSNTLLCLGLLRKANPEGPSIGDRLTVTKLVFHATYELQERSCKALDFNFERWPHGAFTKELYTVWGLLEEADCRYPTPSRSDMKLTDQGRKWGDKVLRLIGDSHQETLVDVFDTVAQTFNKFRSTAEVLDYHYDCEVVPLGWREKVAIRDIPRGTPLTRELGPREAVEAFVLPDSLLQEFDIDVQMGSAQTEEEISMLESYRSDSESLALIADATAEKGELVRYSKEDITKRIVGLTNNQPET